MFGGRVYVLFICIEICLCLETNHFLDVNILANSNITYCCYPHLIWEGFIGKSKSLEFIDW